MRQPTQPGSRAPQFSTWRILYAEIVAYAGFVSRPSGPRRSPDVGRRDWIAERIRARRLALGLTFGQLADRADLRSPSYVFHIERGDKAPSESIAVALARALDDDAELYRAWAQARNRSDLATAITAAATLQRLAAELKIGPSPVGIDQEAGTAHVRQVTEAANPPGGGAPALLRVPVVAEGMDPGEGLLPAAEVIETLRIDPRLLPPLDKLRRVFAYRIGEQGAHRLPEIFADGDYALVSRGLETFAVGDVYAVRVGTRVELGRLTSDGSIFTLSPSAGFSVPRSDSTRIREATVGRMVATIRKWC